jgi:hypothetical protein
LPTVFRAVPTPTFGYIRIFTFNVNDADTFVDEFARLAQALPDTGLIIDVRGNGGGLIHAAERLLQLLTPRMIEPERAQFINTPLNLQICRNHAPSTVFADLSLRPWIDSIALAVRTGAIYSAGYPITPPEACNSVGRRYIGPVLLIIDGLCYSATDMFAAGFQDHGIGPILGVSENTGAGGANVWSHGQLRRLLPDGSSPYRALPKGADLRVAMRRTIRVGLNAGGIVEDLGIEPDRVHRMTRRDIEGGNEDLIDQAAEILAALKAGVSREEGVLHVETGRATHFDLFVNERAAGRFPATGDVTSIALSGVPGWSEEATVEVQGFEENRVVAHHRRASP